MKRRLSVVLILMIILAGCSSSTTEAESQTENETLPEYSDEEIDGMVAALDKEIEALEQKKEELLAMKSTSASDTDWIVEYFVDEFERPTEDPYLQLSFEGSFSNAVTDKAKLTGRIIVDDEFIGIYLNEYGSNPVKNYYHDEKTFYMTVLEEDGNTYSLKWRFLPGSNRLLAYADATGEKADVSGTFEYGTYQTFVNSLRSNDQLTFKLISGMSNTDSYLVEIDNVRGFADLFDATFSVVLTE